MACGTCACSRSAVCALCFCILGSGLPPGHARSAEVHPAARSRRSSATTRSARPLVEGTVARGQLHDDELLYTGKVERRGRDDVPVRRRRRGHGARPAALQHLLLAVPRPHRHRATAWSCAAATAGRRRSPRPAAQRAGRPLLRRHDQRLRRDAGLRRADPAEDRWAIVAYIRALQLSQHATLADVPAAERSRTASDAALTQTADVAIPELAGLPAAAADRRRDRRGWCRCVGWFLEPTQFFQSYLMAYMLCLGVTLGCLALGMVHQLSGGAWGVVIRRPIGAAARVLPVMTVLFLPIVFGMRTSTSGPTPTSSRTTRSLQHKHLYLNVPFFLVRAAIYFAVWNALCLLPERLVARAGPHRRSEACAAHAAAERRRPARLRPDDHLRVVRLADVARAALVLDHLRRADHRRPGTVGAGVPHRRAGVAQPPRAARSHHRPRALPRPRQPDARVRHAVGVLLVLAVPDHLVRQPAGRNRVVHAPAADRLARSSASR